MLFLPELFQISDFIQDSPTEVFYGCHSVGAVMAPEVFPRILFALPCYEIGGRFLAFSDDKFIFPHGEPVGDDISSVDLLLHNLSSLPLRLASFLFGL
jgi:hypothetical protein